MTSRKKSFNGESELRKLQAEFENDFGSAKDHSKASWVRGEVVQRGVNPGSTMHSATMGVQGELYRPGQQLSKQSYNQTNAFNAAKARAEELDAKFNGTAKASLKPKTKKTDSKKKSQLELFKEEIKAKHDATAALKAQAQKRAELSGGSQSLYMPAAVSDQGDPNSTNIFIASIHPIITEDDLQDKFGAFGPLASIKIMYPRSEEEKRKERNCAFVAFCCRKDAEKCMAKLQSKNWNGHDLKLGWGKSVPNIAQVPPIHLPDRLKWFLNPPKPSKLPLNAQPPGEINHEQYGRDRVSECTVRVVIPTDQQLVRLINRVVEFVVREGPMFEAILMDKESNNPMFQFLYDFNCPAHSYYRWRLYSVLNGETLEFWRTKKFVMYKGGPKWRPPILNFKVHGMPDTDEEGEDDFAMLKAHHEKVLESKRESKASFTPIGLGAKSSFGLLNPMDRELEQWEPKHEKKEEKENGHSDEETQSTTMPRAQREEFESGLRTLVPIRELIGDLMALCLEQSDHAVQIVAEIKDAILDECLLNQRLARVYLMSDILFNSTAVPKGSKYRGLFEEYMTEIFEKLNKVHTAIQSRFVAEQFKTRIMTILRAWSDWSLYTTELLIKLNNIFSGIKVGSSDDDVDGKSIDEEDDEDVDGKALSEEEEDVDGAPMDLDNKKGTSTVSGVGTGFVQSKWEAIDEDEIKAEAVTSAEIFADNKRKDVERAYEEVTESKRKKEEAKPLYLQSDAWRQKMRQIEVTVIEYCEQLRVKEDSDQATQYRSTLIRQATEDFQSDPSLWSERSPESTPSRREKKSKKESRSRKRSRSRERRRRDDRSSSRSRSRSRSRDRERRRRHRR